MILDIVFINTLLWSLFIGANQTSKRYIYKILSFIIAMTLAINYSGGIISLNKKEVVANIIRNDYIIPVYEGQKRDYLMTKAFVDELPVTTEIQKKVIKRYYLENIEYVLSEIIAVSAEVVTKAMEMLLTFVIVLVFLNAMGRFISYGEIQNSKKYLNKGINAIVNIIVNVTVLSVFVFLIKLMGNFLLLDLPKIELESSIFNVLIREIVDVFIRLM